MCGIAGFIGFDSAATVTVSRMVTALNHRGPDAQDCWVNESDSIALGHSRLSVVDLSEAGAQPIHSHSGRFVMCYNGEIYNHRDIRAALAKESMAPEWRGSSDSETIVAAIDAWGIEKTLCECVGMFAIAIWDTSKKELTLARDRFGEKPLYYQPETNGVIFGSELVALEQHASCGKRVSDAAILELATKQCIAAPLSIYEGVFKLLPGTLIVFDHTGVLSTKEWWSALDGAEKNQNQWQGTFQEAVDELEPLLEKCVKRQMQSDVPLGAFLSGGIDSSLIVAMMQKNHPDAVKTYSIGFNESNFDEAKYAEKVAKHLGTSHTELYVSESDVCDLVPKLPSIYSEPFADSSQLPTYLVSKLARKDVTVALTGDAGDEIFGGYNRHVFAQQHWPSIRKIPLPMRKAALGLINSIDESKLDKLFGSSRLTSNWSRVGERLHRVGHTVAAANLDELYRFSTSVQDSSHVLAIAEKSVANSGPQSNLLKAREERLLSADNELGALRWMMLKDQLDYMPNDILAKVDRASMACSLETRAPFLDHQLVDFAQQIPAKLLTHENRSKHLLRAVLKKHVPTELFERPKMGFTVPMHNMIKNQLREWADFHLSPTQLKNANAFDQEKIEKLWSDHHKGLRNNIDELWPVLMYQSWAYERSNA